MKFTCSQQTLSKALNTVSKAVSSKSTIPVLKGILLQASSGGTLTLSASDLELSIEKKIDINVEKEGSIVVFSKLFGDIVRKLPNEDILIEELENKTVLIKTSSSEFTIVGVEADEFPEIKEPEDQTGSISFEKQLFKDMVRKTAFSASIDETRGVIVGVLLEIQPDSFNMAALDGFRMAVTREKMENTQTRNIIIPAKILNEVNKILSESEEEDGSISIIPGSRQAVVHMDGTKIVIRLLEGEFIKYKDIIPASSATRVSIGRSALLSSIERASLLAKEGKNNLIKLTLTDGLLTITSRSEEGNVKEELVMEKTGEDLEIGFNSKYIIDVLKVIDEDDIKLEFNTSTAPCLVRPAEGDAFEYLILPVRITSTY